MKIRTARKINPIIEFGIILMALKTSISYSGMIYYPAMVDNLLTILGTAVFLIAIAQHKYSIKVLLAFVFIGLATLYSTICSGEFGLLITIITCMAAYEEDYDSFIEKVFRVELAFFLIHTAVALLLSLIGAINIRVVIRTGGFRYSFGFNHANTFSIYFLNLVMMWVWLYYFQIRKKRKCLIVLILLTLVVYHFTKTRTMLISSFALYGLLIITGNADKKRKWLSECAKFVAPACCLIIIASSVVYVVQLRMADKSPVIALFDRLLSSRIRLGAYGYVNYGLTLFGQNVSQHRVVWDPYFGLTAHTFDDVYTYCAMNAGIIWLVIIFILFYKLAKKANDKINIFIIIWALYGISEVHILNSYMFFPISLIMLLFSSGFRYRKNLTD